MRLARHIWHGVLSLACAGSLCAADELRLPLETSVKVLAAPAPAAPMPMTPGMATPPPPAPTTPGAKYPQYRLGPQQNERTTAGTIENPGIRFFLNLPADTLLVESQITIDGAPFAMVRKQRVAQILGDLQATLNAVAQPGNTAEQKQASGDSGTSFTITKRLRHILSVTGEIPTADEVDWLLTRWIDGPVILPLSTNFQRFRANQRPEFLVLDRNRDGAVSAEELQLAEKSFAECDANQDGSIQFTEIVVPSTDPRLNISNSGPRELIAFVPADVAPAPFSPFETNANGQFDPEELAALRQRTPDLSLAIAFNSAKPDASRIALTGVAEQLRPSIERVSADPTGIMLTIKGTPVILSAVQTQSSDQISIGAVIDGYPLLPALDPNDDGRLTVRERRGLLATLRTFDRNQDGSLTLDEVQSPIRVCVGLGASVHRELAGMRSLYRKEAVPSVTGPEWFVRMDRNKDSDLTRGEFPGTDEQFQDLDADHDELVSADEALKFDKQAEPPKPAATPEPTTKSDATSKEETNKKETTP